MNQRPLDKGRINNQLRRLEEYLDQLEEIRREGKERFLNSDLLQAATERYLQISIETMLNIGNHIIAAKGLRLPGEYADIFRTLAGAGVLKSEVVPKYVDMAKFRNRLVHVYWEVDKEYVWKILENDLNDFVSFQQAVVKLLREG